MAVKVSSFTAFWLNEKRFFGSIFKIQRYLSISRLSLLLKIEFSYGTISSFVVSSGNLSIFKMSRFIYSLWTIFIFKFIFHDFKTTVSTILSSFGVSSECSSFLKLSFTSTANNYQFFDLISFHCKFCNKAHLDQIQFQCYFKNLRHLQINQPKIIRQFSNVLEFDILITSCRSKFFFRRQAEITLTVGNNKA